MIHHSMPGMLCESAWNFTKLVSTLRLSWICNYWSRFRRSYRAGSREFLAPKNVSLAAAAPIAKISYEYNCRMIVSNLNYECTSICLSTYKTCFDIPCHFQIVLSKILLLLEETTWLPITNMSHIHDLVNCENDLKLAGYTVWSS